MLISRRVTPYILSVSLALASGSVFAHAHLKGQTPAENALLETTPKTLTLSFSEGVEQNFSKVTLTGPQKRVIPVGKLTHDGSDTKTLVIPVDTLLDPGRYDVQWQVVSVDGHKTKGAYTFSVK